MFKLVPDDMIHNSNFHKNPLFFENEIHIFYNKTLYKYNISLRLFP